MPQRIERLSVRSMRAALAISTLSLSAHAQAATLTVNTTADASPPAGTCSLRNAIDNANANSTVHAECQPDGAYGADTIVFEPAVFPPETLTTSTVSGQLLLTDSSTTTINGGNAVTLDGGGAKRIFFVSGSAYFEALTIGNGYSTYGGAGIFNSGTTTIDSCVVVGNVAKNGRGGGVYNAGELTVSKSTLIGNTASYGGAIYTAGSFNEGVTVSGSTLAANSAEQSGGAICATVGALTVRDSLISGNTAPYGGGIAFSVTAHYDLVLSGNAVVGNNASQAGGGVFIYGVSYNYPPAVAPTLTNDTFYQNSAGNGGAIYSARYSKPTITSSTFSLNNATAGSVIFSRDFSTTFVNSIVASSTGGSSCSGVVADGGSNIDDATSCGFTSAVGSLAGTNPQLVLPLANNGGPTLTVALGATSPALHFAATCPSTDQRGFSRPSSQCDAGAFEETVYQDSFDN
jgi:CSLREA domain-containing protein